MLNLKKSIAWEQMVLRGIDADQAQGYLDHADWYGRTVNDRVKIFAQPDGSFDLTITPGSAPLPVGTILVLRLKWS